MKYIDLGNGVYTIDFEGKEKTVRGCFYDERPLLQEVRVPDGTTELQDHAFSMCRILKKVYLPKSVTTLGHAVFYGVYQTVEVFYEGTKDEFLALAKPYQKIVSVQVPGPYDHQPYCNTDGTYYEDRLEWQYFDSMCADCQVVCADGERLCYGYSKKDK